MCYSSGKSERKEKIAGSFGAEGTSVQKRWFASMEEKQPFT